jgi:hypothetical protein
MQPTAEAAALPLPCRPDCRYYSSYTTTCDYSLIMYHSRGCPRDACTRYIPRVSARPLPRVQYEPEDGLFYKGKEEKSMLMPEPPLSPPEDDRYLTAGCGHEVYDGEDLFEWENGQTLCSDCLSDRFNDMSLVERAELLGCEHQTINFRPGII